MKSIEGKKFDTTDVENDIKKRESLQKRTLGDSEAKHKRNRVQYVLRHIIKHRGSKTFLKRAFANITETRAASSQLILRAHRLKMIWLPTSYRLDHYDKRTMMQNSLKNMTLETHQQLHVRAARTHKHTQVTSDYRF
jgi:hypothetical protein